ncbi:hypothetical protein [Cellulosimicrobium sp. 22601]|uniref:hypothetical protein n=1 Tax=unclassified Cellulosimicrobium TaxID=2624466 RepID=UPI003F82805A
MRGWITGTPRTPERPTFGGAVAKIAAATGTPLMPWQRHVADVALEVLPDGSWAYTDVLITVQRQQGKTTLDGPIGLHRALTKRYARCWYTAQTRQDARDNLIEDYAVRFESSVLSPLATVRRSQGSEGLYLRRQGSFLRVFAPGEEALHGKPNELVMVDEHWAFTLLEGRALDQAIGPTFTTTGGQYWRHSTAGTDASVWLKEDVDAGRAAVAAGVREGVAYFELGLPDDAHEDVQHGLETDPDGDAFEAAVETLLSHMPARGYTLNERAVRTEITKLARRGAVGEILRAYGNRWTKTVESVIPLRPWVDARRDALPVPTVPVAMAFACAPDRSRSAILAAWREPGDERLMRWKVLDARDGTAWVADRMAELIDARDPIAVGYDRFGPATDVGDELERRGYVLERIGYAEMATSCIATLAAIVEGQLAYVGHEDLDHVAGQAAKKTLGNRWVWDLRGSAGSIAGLDAGTMAAWFFDHADAPLDPPSIMLPSGV